MKERDAQNNWVDKGPRELTTVDKGSIFDQVPYDFQGNEGMDWKDRNAMELEEKKNLKNRKANLDICHGCYVELPKGKVYFHRGMPRPNKKAV